MIVRLETERLILRDCVEADLNNLHKLLSNKQNMYFLDDIITNTLDETAENLKQAIDNSSGHYFCIENKENGEYIGQIGYDIINTTPIGKIVHMGYFILPEQSNNGYTTEAVIKALEFAFHMDNCIRITTACYRDNVPSRRVIEKVGFRKEAEKIKAQFHDGVMKDRLEYALNKDEYM